MLCSGDLGQFSEFLGLPRVFVLNNQLNSSFAFFFIVFSDFATPCWDFSFF